MCITWLQFHVHIKIELGILRIHMYVMLQFILCVSLWFKVLTGDNNDRNDDSVIMNGN